MRRQLVLLFVFIGLIGCNKDDQAAVDIQEMGQQIGDVMASIDESGGSSGTLGASTIEVSRIFETYSREDISKMDEDVHPMALCSQSAGFSACSSSSMTRTFSDCTIGAATFSGTVTLSFSDSSCTMPSAGATVTRVPNFTVTGRRGATLSVSKTGTVGQKIEKTGASSFSFSNDGIRRVFTLPNSTTLLDYTSQTTSAITVSGNSRSSRTMSGGALQVTNNLTSRTCTFSPTAVTWDGTCNCPTSGSWSGSCNDGMTSSLTINSCGSGTLTVGEESESFSFDRCYLL